MCLGWESVKSASTGWLKDGYARVFVQNGTAPHRDLPDVPLAMTFAKDDRSRMLLRLVGRPRWRRMRRVGLATARDHWYFGSGATQSRGTLFGYSTRPR